MTGLNIARNLIKTGSVLVIEKDICGSHASGRNSGVIHAGIYYSEDSLKAKFCKLGNQKLTEYCKRHDLSFKNIGKIMCMKSEFEH